ncbi:MAG: type IX secretion system membrane protein PorP/SprF [Saprospiraceae bacterium]|nr:type IX secretion system membrane protein PorP/SprF [Saprospiraceae bacterium]
MSRQISQLTVLFVFACAIAQAQDPLFSQFYSTPLVLNPAFAGTTYSPAFRPPIATNGLGTPNKVPLFMPHMLLLMNNSCQHSTAASASWL